MITTHIQNGDRMEVRVRRIAAFNGQPEFWTIEYRVLDVNGKEMATFKVFAAKRPAVADGVFYLNEEGGVDLLPEAAAWHKSYDRANGTGVGS